MARTAPPGTRANEASAIECDSLASRSSPASSAAPLIRPNASVICAAPARPARPRSNPASR